jgi:anaerobic selenocysteine-containing dehydrogenase
MSMRISRRDFAKAAAFASLGTAVAGSGVYAEALATEGSLEWAMNATIIDGCSCELLCPCRRKGRSQFR